MVAYNEAEWIRESVLAVRESLVRPDDVEFIVVDDCSTDATAQALDGAGVTVHRLPVRKGAAYARNFGASVATGDVLCWLDAHVWPRRACVDLLAADALANPEAVIVPGHTNFETHPIRIGPLGLDWKGSLDRTRSGKHPINYGSGLVFSVRRHWFYLCVERRDKRRLQPRTACHAVGVTMTRRLFDDIDGWLRLPGFWSGNDAAISIKCWMHGVPVLSEPGAHLFHAIKTFKSHATSSVHQVLNRVYTARTCFSDSLWESFWRPGLMGAVRWHPEFDQIGGPDWEAEREKFTRRVRRSGAEFLKAFVTPRLEAARGAAELVRQAQVQKEAGNG